MSNFYQNVADTVASNNADRQGAASLGTFATTALQVYQQHLQQQKLDTLANMYMAGQNQQADQSYAVANAKPATAVSPDDPDVQGTSAYNSSDGKVFDYQDGATPGSPPTPGQEAATNTSLGYGYNTTPTLPAAPGDMPATGGLAGLQMRMALQRQATQSTLAQNRIQNLQSLIANRNGTTGAANDPNSLSAQRLALAQAAEARRAAAAANAGQPKGPAPQADTIQKLNSDLQTTYGADMGELHDAGKDDIVQQDGGVLYRLGGGPAVRGVVPPKREVFFPQAAHDMLMQRYNRILTGNPMNAVQAHQWGSGSAGNTALSYYQNAANSNAGNPNGGATPPGAGAMQQAQSIKAQVKAGTLSQADGLSQLQALGFN